MIGPVLMEEQRAKIQQDRKRFQAPVYPDPTTAAQPLNRGTSTTTAPVNTSSPWRELAEARGALLASREVEIKALTDRLAAALIENEALRCEVKK